MGLAVSEILNLLQDEYGPSPWQPPPRDPISSLIAGILSQNTSDKNSRPAFEKLKTHFRDWDELAQAEVQDIASVIRCSGMAKQKAQRLKCLLQEIKRQRGSLDLAFLSALPLEEAKAWLKKLPGVGPKTAAVVLLFSLGRPALPVDTHVYRVAHRLGLIDSKVSPEETHHLLEGKLSPKEVCPFHILLLEHGRRVCQARKPLCLRCPLSQDCQYFQKGGEKR